VPSLDSASIDELRQEHKELLDFVDLKLEEYYVKMESMHIKDGLFLVMRFSERGNLFLQSTAYWNLFKTDKRKCDHVVYLSVNLVRLLALLAEPFIPGFSGKL